MKTRMAIKTLWFVGIGVIMVWGVIQGSPAYSEKAPRVSVQILSTHPQLKALTLKGPFTVKTPQGFHHKLPDGLYQLTVTNHWRIQNKSRQWTLPRSTLLVSAPSDTRAITLESATSTQKQNFSVHRSYMGHFIITPQPNETFQVINQVPPEHYVCSVVGSETLPRWSSAPKSIEAFKAMAILTQSRLAHHQKKKQATLLQDSTTDEAYGGVSPCRPTIAQAVHQVWGERLLTPHLYYHSCCGGQRSSVRYFRGLGPTKKEALSPCPYCKPSPFHQWKKFFIPNRSQGNIKILETDPAGRPLQILGSDGTTKTGYQQWLAWGKQWGWGAVPGTHYRVKSSPQGTWIWSRGAGHGVGLCQWGAITMAHQGKTYREILQFYFPGVPLKGAKAP